MRVDEGLSPGVRPGLLGQVATLLAGCAAERGTQNIAVKEIDEREVRSDPELVTSRFPRLADLDEVTWVSGVWSGDVGPSLYWIDAVVDEAASVLVLSTTFE